MADQELRSLLERLRATMDESEVSEQQRAMLEKVEYHLHNEGEPDPEEPSLRESVEVLIEDLSVDHPRSASVARSVLEALASMGI
ncbi:hypothetical protein BGP77_06725 [Saccharospirillum sp. MSK14-1]|uniref:DUF4404 family protein n=1 Tax=Saccharospirillum sp. MSK14-1 TaxID=1897632 RepID=UPI000D343052|nr:DUF4404 family protein [Saccharospirillum sp. MSK14-1]PTY36973.1 hypothetical protein BGP77_06725 [Saccharospirillum sp. MSK14-1]